MKFDLKLDLNVNNRKGSRKSNRDNRVTLEASSYQSPDGSKNNSVASPSQHFSPLLVNEEFNFEQVNNNDKAQHLNISNQTNDSSQKYYQLQRNYQSPKYAQMASLRSRQMASSAVAATMPVAQVVAIDTPKNSLPSRTSPKTQSNAMDAFDNGAPNRSMLELQANNVSVLSAHNRSEFEEQANGTVFIAEGSNRKKLLFRQQSPQISENVNQKHLFANNQVTQQPKSLNESQVDDSFHKNCQIQKVHQSPNYAQLRSKHTSPKSIKMAPVAVPSVAVETPKKSLPSRMFSMNLSPMREALDVDNHNKSILELQTNNSSILSTHNRSEFEQKTNFTSVFIDEGSKRKKLLFRDTSPQISGNVNEKQAFANNPQSKPLNDEEYYTMENAFNDMRECLTEEMLNYMAGFPGQRDSELYNNNYLFYNNERSDHETIEGVEKFISSLWCNFPELENNRTYMKLLFPKRQEKKNPYVHPLQPHEIMMMRENPNIMKLIKTAFFMVVQFFGFNVLNESNGELELSNKYEERFNNLLRNMDNWKDVTRALMFIGEFELHELQYNLLKSLAVQIFQTGILTPLMRSFCKYWFHTLKDNNMKEVLFHEINNMVQNQ